MEIEEASGGADRLAVHPRVSTHPTRLVIAQLPVREISWARSVGRSRFRELTPPSHVNSNPLLSEPKHGYIYLV